jgi:hypothetical protein
MDEDDPIEQLRKQQANKTAGVLKSVRASNVEMTAVQWLWPQRFAVGKLGLLAGLPDEGKGQILADIAARVTRGSELPCDEGRALQGSIILLTAEDDLQDTVVPRLVAAGADLDRVEIVSMVHHSDDKRRMFSLVSDLALLRQKIAEVGEVVCVQIDPVSAYMGVGKIDSYRTNDVRAVLAPLVDLAAELKVSIIGIMHFNKKVDITNALLRLSDSLAYGATSRHVYAVVDDAANQRKLLVKAKNNLTRSAQPALAYSFSVSEVGRDPKTGASIWAPHVVWFPEHVDITASEAMRAATEGRSPAARDDATRFLKDTLADGPMAQTDVVEAARADCISEKTLRRAKRELKIISKKNGSGGTWTWRLPPEKVHWSD